jgi:alanine racemase
MGRVFAEIDLAAVRRNVLALVAATGRPLIAVVKANAYGHGAIPVGEACLEAGARMLAVATVEEAEELRAALGPRAPLLVLGALLDEERLAALAARVTTVVHGREDLERIARVARSIGTEARIHVKVDVGLARHGVPLDEARALLEAASREPGVVLEGLMTHLPRASSRESTLESLAAFDGLVRVARASTPGLLVHAAASTAALLHEEARHDAIRPGIALHGIDPEGAARAAGVALEPTLSLRAKIVRVREVEAGTPVGYGATWTAPRRTRLAVVGIGYDDGLPYRLGNQGTLLVGGARCPIVGTVMMDYVACDVTDIQGVAPGDVATVIGRDGECTITAEEVARAVGVIPYVVTCGLGRRVKRVLLGERVRVADPGELTQSQKIRRLRSG